MYVFSEKHVRLLDKTLTSFYVKIIVLGNVLNISHLCFVGDHRAYCVKYLPNVNLMWNLQDDKC